MVMMVYIEEIIPLCGISVRLAGDAIFVAGFTSRRPPAVWKLSVVAGNMRQNGGLRLNRDCAHAKGERDAKQRDPGQKARQKWRSCGFHGQST